MCDILSQITILARNNDDDGGWVQLLIFLVMAVFWVVGGILKAKANRASTEDGQQGPKPAQKPPQARPTARVRPLAQLQPQKPQIAVRKEPVAQRFAAAQKAYEPKLEGPIEIIPKSEKITQLDLIRSPAAKATKPQDTKSILELKDSDDLRKAILHYEILGKPLALRGPEGQAWWNV